MKLSRLFRTLIACLLIAAGALAPALTARAETNIFGDIINKTLRPPSRPLPARGVVILREKRKTT